MNSSVVKHLVADANHKCFTFDALALVQSLTFHVKAVLPGHRVTSSPPVMLLAQQVHTVNSRT